jgi:hypothetical protein
MSTHVVAIPCPCCGLHRCSCDWRRCHVCSKCLTAHCDCLWKVTVLFNDQTEDTSVYTSFDEAANTVGGYCLIQTTRCIVVYNRNKQYRYIEVQ